MSLLLLLGGAAAVNATANPDGVASTTAAGSLGISIPVVGIAGVEATAVVGEAVGIGTAIEPDGFANTQSFGTVAFNSTIAAAGFANAQTFGSAGLNATIAVAGLENAQAFGQPFVGSVPHVIEPTGFANAQSFGTVAFRGEIDAVGFANAHVFGTAAVHGTIAAVGIASSTVFGTAVLVFPHEIQPNGFANSQSFGSPRLAEDITGGNVIWRWPLEFTEEHPIGPRGFANYQSFGRPRGIVHVLGVAGFVDRSAVGQHLVPHRRRRRRFLRRATVGAGSPKTRFGRAVIYDIKLIKHVVDCSGKHVGRPSVDISLRIEETLQVMPFDV